MPEAVGLYPVAQKWGYAMQIGIIGRKPASALVAKRWLQAGYQVVGFDPHHEPGNVAWPTGTMLIDRFDDLAIVLSPPRTLWMAMQSRAETECVYNTLLPLLDRGDTVIDAGRSYYKDTLRRALVFSRFQYWLIDVGICGAWPLTDGCCLAIGGDRSMVERLSGLAVSSMRSELRAHKAGAGSAGRERAISQGCSIKP